jgi:hypothetical protein
LPTRPGLDFWQALKGPVRWLSFSFSLFCFDAVLVTDDLRFGLDLRFGHLGLGRRYGRNLGRRLFWCDRCRRYFSFCFSNNRRKGNG